jgi:tRNA-Thr(GGU) m(6)t(6)A37 methyltransferase TsaA
MNIIIKPIGIIHSPFSTKQTTPPQGILLPQTEGTVEVFPEFADGLKDIETFTHLYLIYHFDRAGEIQLVRPTFLDDTPHGVFASRHPCRPNGLGLSVVRLLERTGNLLKVSEIDVLDKTPLIDIKPYVPRFDHRPDASNGWVAEKPLRPKPEGRE